MSVLGTVLRPPLPYVGAIPGGSLTSGFQIIIQGSVPYNADQFAFNLATGSAIGNARSDTALHFNPRFSQNCVVRNSYRSNVWAAEERGNGMPFTKGNKFEVIIYADANCYKITVNSNLFCDFQHRMPKESVNTLTIEGNVSIEVIKFVGMQSSSGFSGGFVNPLKPGHGMPAPQYPPAMPMGPILNPILPLTTQIPTGLYHGSMIFISATPRGTNRFTVNLQEGTYPDCDIGLHFDVRFNLGGVNNNVIVRNHRSGKTWGQEERDVPYFPFSANSPFEMLILCENTGFKVAINNQHMLEFRHRLTPFSRFNTFNMSGDITVHQVRFQ